MYTNYTARIAIVTRTIPRCGQGNPHLQSLGDAMFFTSLVPSLLPAAIFNGKERTRLVFDHVWWVADIGIDRA